MVERQEVEALLRHAGVSEADGRLLASASPHTLSALCRAWLAVQDGPEVCVSKSAVMGEGWEIYGTKDGDIIESLPFEDGQRVRIVREPTND